MGLPACDVTRGSILPRPLFIASVGLRGPSRSQRREEEIRVVCLPPISPVQRMSPKPIDTEKLGKTLKWFTVLNNLAKELQSHDPAVLRDSCRAVSVLVKAEILDREFVESHRLFSRLMFVLTGGPVVFHSGDDLAAAAEAIVALTEAKLVDAEIIRSQLDQQFEDLLKRNRNGDVSLRTLRAIKVFVEAGLLDNKRTKESVFGHIEQQVFVEGFRRVSKTYACDDLAGTCEKIGILVGLRWLTHHGLPEIGHGLWQVDPYPWSDVSSELRLLGHLERAMQENDGETRAVAAKTLCVLVEAGYFDKQWVRQRFMEAEYAGGSPTRLQNFFRYLDHCSDETKIGGVRAIKMLVEMGLFDRESLLAEVANWSGEHLEVRGINSVKAQEVLAAAGLTDGADMPEWALKQKQPIEEALPTHRLLEKLQEEIDVCAIETIVDRQHAGADDFYSAEEMAYFYFHGYVTLESKDKRQVVVAHCSWQGQVGFEDVRRIATLIETAKDEDDRRELYAVMVAFTLMSSNDAQVWLERQVEGVLARPIDTEIGFIPTDSRDQQLVEAINKSSRQTVLLPFVYRGDVQPSMRKTCITLLAEANLIDWAYLELPSDSTASQQALANITTIHEILRTDATPHFVPPARLVQMVCEERIAISELKALQAELDGLEAANDFRYTVQGLAQSDKLLTAYYCFRQPPFTYPGTTTPSFERFSEIVKEAAASLKQVDWTVVIETFKDSLVVAGMPEQEAKEAAENMVKGGPPLPNNSPYLDEQGRFVPQEVSLAQAIQQDAGAKKAKESFESALKTAVLLFRINALMEGINKRIDACRDPEVRGTYSRAKERFNNSGLAALDEVYGLLIVVNNELYKNPKTPIEQILANRLTQATRRALRGEFGQVGFVEREDLGYAGLNIDHLTGVLPRLMAIFEEKEKPMDARDLMLIFHRNVFSALRGWESFGLSAQPEAECKGDLASAFGAYFLAVQGKLALLPPTMSLQDRLYLDWVDRRNLLELLRYSDGAHCCCSSDPKVNSLFGAGIYSNNIHRWLADITTMFFQVTTAPRSEKQVGWLKCWPGMAPEDGRPFVGSNYAYLHPAYHNPEVNVWLWATIERVLFSLPLTRVAQARAGYLPSNALMPPDGYKEQELRVVRLQALKDGRPIQADVKFLPNQETSAMFLLKPNSSS